MTYQEAVAQAAGALIQGEDANWTLARLTCEYTRTGRGSMRTEQPGTVTMEVWCAAVRAASGRRFAADTGFTYKRAWATYGHLSTQDRPPFTQIWFETAGRSAEEGRDARAQSGIRLASVDAKRQIARDLIRDPDVIQDPMTRSSIANAYHAELSREEMVSEGARTADPVTRKSETIAALALGKACDTFARMVRDIFPTLGPLPESEKFWLRQSLNNVRGATEAIENYINDGTTDVDAWIAEALGGHRG